MTTTARASTWRDAGTRGASRRLAGSIGASAALHVLAIVALAVRAGRHAPPSPPVYRVDLVAAPPGERAIGTVAPEPPPPAAAAAPTPEAPAATPPPRPETRPREMPAPASPKAKPLPPAATPVPPPAKATPPKAPAKTPPKPTQLPSPTASKLPPLRRTPDGPRAGGGPEGGRGADVANVHVAGLDFPYEGYLANIVRQVALRFKPAGRNAALQADAAFLIHRDGSVTDVRMVKGSGNYAFDLEARGAVEEAGRAKAFGPLPSGFGADVLPVTFSFDPRVIR